MDPAAQSRALPAPAPATAAESEELMDVFGIHADLISEAVGVAGE